MQECPLLAVSKGHNKPNVGAGRSTALQHERSMTKKRATECKCLFVSSVQKELQDERRGVKQFVEGDPLLRRYFEVFLFEDLPASDRKADDVYLEEVERCDAYVGLFGNEYGSEDAEGISPTEREFVNGQVKRDQ